jgi:HEAT repeat protein
MSAWALGEIEDPRGVAPLAKVLDHADAGVRAAAVCSLGNLKDPRSAPWLIKRLSDSSPAVRELAASGLGELQSRAAAMPLITAIEDKDLGVRRASARAGEIQDARAVPARGSQDADTESGGGRARPRRDRVPGRCAARAAVRRSPT